MRRIATSALTAALLGGLLVAPACASPPPVHMAVGDWVGEWAARHIGDPALAAVVTALGAVASHAALDMLHADYTPDWMAWRRDLGRLARDAPYLLVQAALVWMVVQDIADEPDPRVRALRILGVVSAVLPDLAEVPHSVADPASWRRGEHLMPWHRAGAGRTEEPMHVSLAVSAAVVAVRLSF